MIRRASIRDVSRIAEILVFSKRVNYRRIFHNDLYSFGELQVLKVAQEYLEDPEELEEVWVYEEDFVMGLIQLRGREVKKLYVDPFFVGLGIGGRLLSFAVDRFDAGYLWALEKNERALAFYARYGFHHSEPGNWKRERRNGF